MSSQLGTLARRPLRRRPVAAAPLEVAGSSDPDDHEGLTPS
jgi:hypothetical protein